jgi:pimeloyl-ACP methyl ester carboxylesterase
MLVASNSERRGYVDTDAGQVHYRDCGEGPAVVLLHWTPGTSHQYAALLPALAEAGYRAIAPDLPGFGMSCRREGHWPVGEFSANLQQCLDGWGLEQAVLWGGHFAAEIALEVAVSAPERVALLILDGTPAWDEATRRDILAQAKPADPKPREDGSHLTDLWSHLLWEVGLWRPGHAFDDEIGAFAMRLLASRMLADFDWRPARSLLEYDALDALERLTVPLLALTAEQDPLFACHATVLEIVSGARGHVFAGGHPVHDAARVAEYLEPVLPQLAAAVGAHQAVVDRAAP